MKRIFKIAAALCVAFIGFALHAQTSTGYYSQYQVQSSVARATVIGVREVALKTNNQNSNMSYAGQALGGLLGAIVTKGSDYAMSSAGTIVGSILGQKIATDWGSEAKAQEIIIKTDSGAVTAITQSSADGVIFFVGQRVIIIGQGRVAPSPDGL